MTNSEVIALTEKYVLPTYRRIDVSFVRGEGCFLFDSDGKRYLDFGSGIAVTSQGHCHPKVVEAVQKQAAELIHCSNLFHIPGQALLAEKLCVSSSLEKAFFCNSGAEANEAAIKMARKWGREHKNGSYEIVVATNSFHGRTLGALSATAQRKYQKDFEPLVPGFVDVPYGDLPALSAAMGPQTVAIMLEPVQGEGGVRPAPMGYLRAVAGLAREAEVLLILDEVQTGMGRTGKMFAHEHSGIKPDLLTLAKALGSGVPIGALLVGKKAVETFQPGDHASTYGGNPLVTAAALASFEVIEDGLVENAAQVGNYFKDRLLALQKRQPLIKEIRGLGLLLAAELNIPAGDVVTAVRERGLLVLTAGEQTLRFAPPLIIGETQVDTAMEILEAVLADF